MHNITVTMTTEEEKARVTLEPPHHHPSTHAPLWPAPVSQATATYNPSITGISTV